MVEEEVGSNVAEGGGASHGSMGHQRDEKVKDCTADEEDLEGYEDEENFVRHLNKCMIALRGELDSELQKAPMSCKRETCSDLLQRRCC